MATKQQTEAQNPLILRCNRIMEAFAKSDDERDFYLDRYEGFLIYADLDKPDEDLQVFEKELIKNKERYCMIPKLTFYETKKIMEGFINEKVYDIDTKEKLLEIIQSKEAREHFLEFIYDHHSELEKWQIFYQERSRIRIIEWLRTNNFHFVFEEDLELPRMILEKLKKELFQVKVGKEIVNARKILYAKAKTYYSNEALNPRPKRGRPPKQTQKTEIEPQVTTDIYTTVPNGLLGFLFIPDLTNPSSATFSSKFGNEGDLFSNRRPQLSDNDLSLETLNIKLQELRSLSNKWKSPDDEKAAARATKKKVVSFDDDEDDDFDDDEDDDFDDDEDDEIGSKKKSTSLKGFNKKAPKKPTKVVASKSPAVKPVPAPKAKAASLKKIAPAKTAPAAKSKPVVKAKPVAKAKPKPKAKPVAKAAPKKTAKAAPPKKQKALRPMIKLKRKVK
ncbi:MAG TPA: UPF0158 family protein [Parachlamydiaceae bacterium]|nr:UPF0158 family protein [Parachlamydiaceae bacterium]